MNYWFGKKTSEISSERAAEFGFFSVSTKMKAQGACANAPINVEPEGGGGGWATHRNLTVMHIPRVGILT